MSGWGRESFGQIELYIKALEVWEYSGLHLGTDLTVRSLFLMEQGWIGKESTLADVCGCHVGQLLPTLALREFSRWAYGHRFAARHGYPGIDLWC